MSIDEIEAAALELPLDQREELIARLHAAHAANRETDAAWRAEVRRRMELIHAGDVEWFDEEEVLAELEADS
ncbi:addiction module protein [Longimicrobium sp.]|uniref:addiction module protein n=1 Tax=Longimicrobium sp. TaxID=2029185 RepID=UPI003B3AA297